MGNLPNWFMKKHHLMMATAAAPLIATIVTIAGLGSAAMMTPAFAHGCTPGFWKNHPEQLPFSETATLNELFGVSLPSDLNLTAEEALNARGGGFNALARHAVAALANSLTIDDYKYSDTQVINMFKDAIDPNVIQISGIADDNDLESIKNKFESANEAPSCPF
jgi:hypothetical protein